MKGFQKWVVEIQIADTWVEDGFEITNDNIVDRLQEWLPYAYSHEVNGKVLKAPKQSVIKKLQGE